LFQIWEDATGDAFCLQGAALTVLGRTQKLGSELENMAGLDQSPAHVRFLNVMNALRKMSPLRGLTADEGVLLDELIVQWHFGRQITVGSIMNRSKLGAGSTVHRRLVGLKEKGLVAFRASPDDKRVKYVEPTTQAKSYALELERRLCGFELDLGAP
jgi:hypothetical protein